MAITIVFNKQPSSANSGQPLLILMTKNIEKYYPTWNVESIQKRQEEMAKKAVNIWNL